MHYINMIMAAYKIYRTRTHHGNSLQSHGIDFNYDVFPANAFCAPVGMQRKQD